MKYSNNRKRHNKIPSGIAAVIAAVILICLIAVIFGISEKYGSEFKSVWQDLSGNQTDTENFGNDDLTSDGENILQITVFDCGQGLSIMAEQGGNTLLFDGGPEGFEDDLLKQLSQKNIGTLDYVIASHYDSDHVSGLFQVIRSFSIETFIAPEYDKIEGSIDEALKNLAAEYNIDITCPQVGETYSLGDASFTILSPDRVFEESNSNSVVIRLDYAGRSIMLTGDATQESEDIMIENGLDLSCDIIVAAHHGSKYSSSDEFLSAAGADAAVISAGAGNEYGHPHDETLERFKEHSMKVYRTDTEGNIIIRMGNSGINITTE